MHIYGCRIIQRFLDNFPKECTDPIYNDIIDNNDLPRDYFKEDFFELIGDILVDIITNEEPVVDNN